MKTVISRDSVRRANAAMINKVAGGVSMDSRHVSVRVETSTLTRNLTFPRARIVEEANKAFAKIVK